MAYVNHKGGPSPALSKLAMAIWAEAIEIGVSIKCAHIAGVENQEGPQTQLEASSQTFCLPGPFLGSTHTRQIRELSKYTASSIQQQVLGAVVRSGRRIVSGHLGLQKQFCQRTVLPAAQSFRRNSRLAGSSNSYCAQPWYSRLQSMAVAPPLRHRTAQGYV